MTLCANRIAALVLRAVGSVLGVFGIAVMLTMTDASLMLSYFTMQTNIFTTAAFIVLTVMTAVQLKERGVRGEVAHLGVSLQLALTFFITITFVVYWAMLSWQNFDMGGGDPTRAALVSAANYMVHGVVPLLAIADWILFLPHGRLRAKDAALWLIYPIAYAVFIFIRAEVGAPFYGTTRYPYPFIDVDILGGWVALIVIAMAVAFYALGRLFVFLDGKLAVKTAALICAAAESEYVREERTRI